LGYRVCGNHRFRRPCNRIRSSRPENWDLITTIDDLRLGSAPGIPPRTIMLLSNIPPVMLAKPPPPHHAEGQSSPFTRPLLATISVSLDRMQRHTEALEREDAEQQSPFHRCNATYISRTGRRVLGWTVNSARFRYRATSDQALGPRKQRLNQWNQMITS
jgi:hypothetical protein